MEKKSLFALEIILIILAAGAAYAGITTLDWPMPYHDVMHTSYLKAISRDNISGITLLRTYNSQAHMSTPVTADINGDDKGEVLFSAGNSIYVLDSDFQVVWVKNLSCQPTAPSVYDLFADGKTEILYGCSDGGINLIDPMGNVIWSYQANGSIEYSPIAANLDNTKPLEVIAASKDKNIYVFDASGNKLRDYYIPDSGFMVPALGDLDADKKNEIIIGSLDNKAYSISFYKGDEMVFDTQGAVTSPVVVKMNRTNTYRIAIGTSDGHLYSLYFSSYNIGSKRRCNLTACTYIPVKVSKIAVSWDFTDGEGAVAQPAVADLNGDREAEYVFGNSDRTLYILNSNGVILKKHSINGKITSAPSIADLNGDKHPEIVYGSSDGMVQILASNGSRVWDFHSIDSITESPAIADLDRNGKLEILIPSGSNLYLFGEEDYGQQVAEVNASSNETELNFTTNTTNTTVNLTTTTSSSTTTTSVLETNETSTTLFVPSSTTTTSILDEANETSTTLFIAPSATLPESENYSGNISSEATFIGQPLQTVMVVAIAGFFLIQLFLVMVIYIVPGIIHRKIEKIRLDIKTYRNDLNLLDKAQDHKQA